MGSRTVTVKRGQAAWAVPLLRAIFCGKCIQYEGSVSDIKVLGKTAQKFSRAVVHAVSRWRFMPWDISYKKPAAVRESVEYLSGWIGWSDGHG